MKLFRHQKGFTLIELLIVVAIIGVLAAVGIPMYNGYILQAKQNATKEQHQRVVSVISAKMTECAMKGSSGTIKINWQHGPYNVSCGQSLAQLAAFFQGHFNFGGWENPYGNNYGYCCKQSGGSLSGNNELGISQMHFKGNNITVLTHWKEGAPLLRAMIPRE